MGDKFDHGPLRTYELIWRSGHVETVQGHSVTFDSSVMAFSHLMPGGAPALQPKFRVYGEIGGHWRLVLVAPEEDLVTIRDVTANDEPARDR